MAAKMRCSKQQVSNIENSDSKSGPTLRTLERYARALGAKLKVCS